MQWDSKRGGKRGGGGLRSTKDNMVFGKRGGGGLFFFWGGQTFSVLVWIGATNPESALGNKRFIYTLPQCTRIINDLHEF